MLDKGEGSMDKVKVNALKWKQRLSWRRRQWNSKWADLARAVDEVLDLEWGVGPEEIQRSRASVWFHHSQSHLYHRKEKGRFSGHLSKVIVSGHLSKVIHPYFICVVSSPTVTCKSVAEYLRCIYVMALAQARKSLRLVELFPSEAL